MKTKLFTLIAICTCAFSSCAPLPPGQTYANLFGGVGQLVDSSKVLAESAGYTAPVAPVVTAEK
jgi:hypothetical protein